MKQLLKILAVICGLMLSLATVARADTSVTNLLTDLKTKYAPDAHLAVYSVSMEQDGSENILRGDVGSLAAKADTVAVLKKAGVKFTDEVQVLPAEELGDKKWGIATLSVASGREGPEHKAEMGTQVLMGRVVHVLKSATNNMWYLVQSADGYLSWLEKGTFVRCTREAANAWVKASLLIVTVFDETIRETPAPDSLPVSDLVIADLLKKIGEEGDAYKVELPDGRTGYIPKKSAEDYAIWKSERKATGDKIESTAKSLLGRPYLWGANSPKGLDCSGFSKLVFLLNGIDLRRNASQQVHEGKEVVLDADLSQLKKGDLLFFGGRHRREGGSGAPRITHVAIYLGNKLFIQSSERVQINSLDMNSPIKDEHRIRSLVAVRRVLAE